MCTVQVLQAGKIYIQFVSPSSSLLAGVFKESKLRKVHPEGPAGGPDAASVEVSPPPPGETLHNKPVS